MTPRRIVLDRIALTLEGLPVAQAELLAANLQAALAAQSFGHLDGGDDAASGNALHTDLTGQALVTAVAARLAGLLAAAPEVLAAGPEALPWP